MNKSITYENYKPNLFYQFKNILLIEDDADTAELLKINLQNKYSCLVQIAGDPFEAIHLMIENFYDLILLDWQLPGFNGFETLIKTEHSLKHEPFIPLQWELKKIPVVIISASKKNECLTRNTKHFNFTGYVSKTQKFNNVINLLGEFIVHDNKSKSLIASYFKY